MISGLEEGKIVVADFYTLFESESAPRRLVGGIPPPML